MFVEIRSHETENIKCDCKSTVKYAKLMLQICKGMVVIRGKSDCQNYEAWK
jgi:hypothetical protein